jgi:hypothetical protein
MRDRWAMYQDLRADGCGRLRAFVFAFGFLRY